MRKIIDNTISSVPWDEVTSGFIIAAHKTKRNSIYVLTTIHDRGDIPRCYSFESVNGKECLAKEFTYKEIIENVFSMEDYDMYEFNNFQEMVEFIDF